MNADFERQYWTAVGLMVVSGSGSTSYIQRKLNIGYSDARQLIEKMEADGVLSAPNTVGKREVLLRVSSK